MTTKKPLSKIRMSAAMLAFWSLALAASASAQQQQKRTNVAIFNFQMKSDTSDWLWLEKGLADQITTDFVRAGNGLTVLARDDMQSAADKVKWTPELLADEQGMVELRRSLTVEKIVTGVYTVQGEQISITAQVVQVSTREVKDRQEVAGKAADVLDLQRQLSAKLVGYFTGKSADKVLPELPVWTRSIPATKALYEGVDLYDQGRFGEAWLRFRQASRDDGGYLEAQYWVGKMYYFMDRYEHARRAFERFVYMDQNHPRLGDAIKEYLHTYEKLDAPVDVLASLYEDLGRRYPEAKIYNEMGGPGPLPNQPWLWARQAQAVSFAGRFGEASELGGKAMERIYAHPYFFHMSHWTTGYLQNHNLISGNVILPESYTRAAGWQRLTFAEGQSSAELALKSPVAAGKRAQFYLIAPDGYFFKKIHMAPVSDNGAVATFSFWNWQTNDIPPDGNDPTTRPAGQTGQTFSNMPRLGLVRVFMNVQAGVGNVATAKGIRAEAVLEKIGPHGAIAPYPSTRDMAFDIDGHPGYGSAHIAGLLAPGEYTVRLRPFHADSPWGSCQAKAVVRDGQVTPLAMRVPWKSGSPFEGWTQCDAPNIRGQIGLQEVAPQVRLLMGEKAIRAVFHYQGDLWTMVSTDGNTFSKAVKVPLPVSSAWAEIIPVCLRDESGRFLLMFRSSRDARHRAPPYMCWSRDFVHWSAPSQVVPNPVMDYDFLQDPQGRFLLVEIPYPNRGNVVVLASRDAYRWEEVASIRPKSGSPQYVRIINSPNGFDLLISGPGGLEHHTSVDGNVWAFAERVGESGQLISPPGFERVDGRLVAAVTVAVGKMPEYWHNHMQVFRQQEGGAWEQSKPMPGFWANGGAMSYHPRWGYVMGWAWNSLALRAGDRDWGGCSVFITRGQSVDAFFRPAPAALPPGSVADAAPPAGPAKQ